jgi:hypothetical protein
VAERARRQSGGAQMGGGGEAVGAGADHRDVASGDRPHTIRDCAVDACRPWRLRHGKTVRSHCLLSFHAAAVARLCAYAIMVNIRLPAARGSGRWRARLFLSRRNECDR